MADQTQPPADQPDNPEHPGRHRLDEPEPPTPIPDQIQPGWGLCCCEQCKGDQPHA